ncbi:MAG: hypothetical protein HS122_03495 [Opitutaceae bacterium]|nr:hypothetical protein [Opitutaceae bacterium]
MTLPFLRQLQVLHAFLAAAVSLASAHSLLAGSSDRKVDLRFGIPTWHQPLGIPADWHKPMANERGALLYDFGPGPYVQGATVVEATAEGPAFSLDRQTFEESPRLPILRTRLTQGSDVLSVTTLALPPSQPSPSNGRSNGHERLDGIAGAIDWANPPEEVSPQFRNVAWGVNRPIRYRIRVTEGDSKKVMLGFCESYKRILNQRIAEMRVEGSPSQIVDLALNAPTNQPQVFLFNAHDANNDGWIDIAVVAPQGHDPNTTLATIAVYAAGTSLNRQELLEGSLSASDRAELRIACGTEMRSQDPRVDLIHAAYSPGSRPVVAIRTRRLLQFNENGLVTNGGRIFLDTTPHATGFTRSAQGWNLEFPQGTREVLVRVFSGNASPDDVRPAPTSLKDALRISRERWSKLNIPHGRITVADPSIQAMVDASIRTVYQAQETVNGQTQFNSSFTLYRGLWAGDAVYIATLAAQLGDSTSARQTFDALLSHQRPDGIIDELHPQQIYRTTAEVIWAIEHDAQISGNWDYARSKWRQIMLGIQGIRALRDSTLAHPDSPFAGLFPPGFSDGGILDIGAEYSSVYCTITGLKAAGRMARKLGFDSDAASIESLAEEFRSSFDLHRRRDQRRDSHGNLYLPVRVGFKGNDPIPQLTQWAFMDASINGGGWLPSNHELVTGTFALLESVEQQGLPVSMGWMPGGNWAGMGLFYGIEALILGRDVKAADVLYAAANHASPLGTWVEEQSLVGKPLKLAGDQPHCFAAAAMPLLVGSMLAYEHNGAIHLLGSVPEEWLRAEAVNSLKQWKTAGGSISLRLAVNEDGSVMSLRVDPIENARPSGSVILHTASLTRAGFKIAGLAADGLISIPAGQPFELSAKR